MFFQWITSNFLHGDEQTSIANESEESIETHRSITRQNQYTSIKDHHSVLHYLFFLIEATITSGSVILITLDTSSPKFRRLGGDAANYYYSTVRISVDQAGSHTFTSTSDIATNGFIYIDSFNPENASANIFAQDYGSSNSGQYAISVSLQTTNQGSRRVCPNWVISHLLQTRARGIIFHDRMHRERVASVYGKAILFSENFEMLFDYGNRIMHTALAHVGLTNISHFCHHLSIFSPISSFLIFLISF